MIKTPPNTYGRALHLVSSHVAKTLPDSLQDRKSLLSALSVLLAGDHQALPSIRAQLAAIDAIETLQQELPLKFS